MDLLLPELHQLIVYDIDELSDLLNVRLVSRAWLQYVRKVKRLIWHNGHTQDGLGIMKIFPNLNTILNCKVEFPVDKLSPNLRCGTVVIDTSTIARSLLPSSYKHITSHLIQLLENKANCSLVIGNINGSFGFEISERKLYIINNGIGFSNLAYIDEVRRLIQVYIDWKQHHINIAIDDPLFDLPWEKLDSFSVTWIYERDHAIYKKLVEEGKLKHFSTTTLIDEKVVDVEYQIKHVDKVTLSTEEID